MQQPKCRAQDHLRLLVACCLLLAPGFLHAESGPDSEATPQFRVVAGGPVSVSARIKPRRGAKPLTVGDQFELELTVKYHRDVKVSPPASPEFEPFLALDRKTVTRYAGDTVVDVHTIRLAAFNTGELRIPPFFVTYPKEGEVVAAASDSIPLTVVSVLPKEMVDVNDIKPQVQFPNLLPLWILLGIIGTAVLVIAGLRLYRRYRRVRLCGAPLPDPWDEALAALGAIPASEWLTKGQVKRYYYTVSEVLKRYLTRRFNFPAIDQTTTEIIRSLKLQHGNKAQDRVPKSTVEEFGRFFQQADLVKYAKYVPPPTETAAALSTARGLVQATIPQPEPESGVPTAK